MDNKNNNERKISSRWDFIISFIDGKLKTEIGDNIMLSIVAILILLVIFG